MKIPKHMYKLNMLIEQAKLRQTIRKCAISKRKRGKKRTKKQQSEQHKSLKNLIYCWQKRWLIMISVTANDNNNHNNKWNKSNIFHDNLFGFFFVLLRHFHYICSFFAFDENLIPSRTIPFFFIVLLIFHLFTFCRHIKYFNHFIR